MVLAVLLLVPAGSGVTQTSDVEPDEHVLLEVPSEAAGGDASPWLLVMDRSPWGRTAPQDVLNTNGIAFDVIRSADLASTTLDDYVGVLVPSVQANTYYDNLNANAAAIASYVAGGGLLVAHAAQYTSTGAATDFLPGCTQYGTSLQNSATIADATSPIVDGVPESALQGWGYTAHGALDGLPMVSSVVIENGAGEPIYVTYPWGTGSVLATGMTLEWVFGQGPPRSLIMDNEVTFDPVTQGDVVGGLLNLLTTTC